MGKVTSLLEGETKSGSELIVSRTTTTEPCAEKQMERQAAEKSKEVILLKGDDELEGRERNSQQGSADQKQANSEKAAAAEEKAAKIQRLKSGFRICKPQGSFLWPSMVNNPNSNPTTSTNNNNSTVSPQVVVQVEDLFVVPTPPSVSSSTTTAPPQLPNHHHQHNPASPVKPLAERRAVTVTVSSTISKGPLQSYDDGGNNYTTTTTTTDGNKTTTLINLTDPNWPP